MTNLERIWHFTNYLLCKNGEMLSVSKPHYILFFVQGLTAFYYKRYALDEDFFVEYQDIFIGKIKLHYFYGKKYLFNESLYNINPLKIELEDYVLSAIKIVIEKTARLNEHSLLNIIFSSNMLKDSLLPDAFCDDCTFKFLVPKESIAKIFDNDYSNLFKGVL